MPRPARRLPAGLAYLLLNCAKARLPIFAAAEDAERFVTTLAEAVGRWPAARLMYWLAPTHTQRHHVAHGTAGQRPRSSAGPS